MRALARERGGQCLSLSYVDDRTPLRWRCTCGHEWTSRPMTVVQGRWCPACAGSRRLTIEDLQAEAAKHNGRLLSASYSGIASHMEWECALGHRWETSAKVIRAGHWCPQCAGVPTVSLEDMQELARARGGVCLSRRYVNAVTPLRWQCAEGHIWKASASRFRGKYSDRESWCPVCRRTRYTIEDMRLLAAARGGECLSNVYVDHRTHLRWRCARGHVWEAQPGAIRPKKNHPGTWCPTCEDESLKLTLDQMRELARKHGGECLSTSYRNARSPLEWRCSSGHVFLATPTNLKSRPSRPASWCPVCARRRRPKIAVKMGARR